MPPTTGFDRGDVVLVEFVFTDESGTRVRPALIINSPAYAAARNEIIVAAITSNVTRRLSGDYRLIGWRHAGLLYPSSVTGIIRTVRRSMIRRRLGTLTATDLAAYDRVLQASLGFAAP